MKKFFLFVIAVVFVLGLAVLIGNEYKKVTANTVEKIKPYVVKDDYEALAALESEFCQICQDPTAGRSYNDTIKYLQDNILPQRDLILEKYKMKGKMSWICHTDGRCLTKGEYF